MQLYRYNDGSIKLIMQLYRYKDGSIKYKMRITFGIGIREIVSVIAWKTDDDGKHILNHKTKEVKDWTRTDILKTVRDAYHTNGESAWEATEYTETQEQATEKIVKNLFPELVG